MCLYRVTKVRNLPVQVTAWKILGVYGNDLRTPVQNTKIKRDEWNVVPTKFTLEAENNSGRCYTGGFHAYARLEDARVSWMLEDCPDRKIFRVHLRGLLCFGRGDGGSCSKLSDQWVASKMRVVREEPGGASCV